MLAETGVRPDPPPRMRLAPTPSSPPSRLAAPVVNHVVDRPRLYAQLTAGLRCPVTMVAATAGWGKTLLAASWIAAGAGGRPSAWVHLEADDDAAGFWRAVAEALAPVVGPQAGAALGRLVAGSAAAASDMPGALAAALRHATRPVVLVLDNLQEVTTPEVHDGLVRLVERPLPALSLLVLTRQDPPWPLAHLRLAGLLTEVRAENLAFRVDEARELFAQLQVDLDGSQVGRLVERTEGWPAGLRLVALHLQGRRDVEAAVNAFSGDDHSVAGYLVAEVLDAQPPELVRFLEKISTVDLVCADLADALTGRRDSEQVLAELAASHLFVQAVDRPGRWYHLHRLIRDILRSRPAARRERRDLRRRAAEWFSRNGMPLDAIRSAVAGELWPLAADLVGRHSVVFALRGHARELERALRQIPRPVLAAHPELACGLAGARIVRGVVSEVAELLAGARAGLAALPERRARRVRLLVDLVDGALARVRGDWDAAAAVYRTVPVDPVALAGIGLVDAVLVPVLVDNILGSAALLGGDLPTADRHLTAALSVELSTPSVSQLNAAGYLSLLTCERGELDAAQARALAVVARASAAGLERAGQVAGAYLTLARVALDRADLSEIDDWLGRVAEVQAVAAEPHVRLVAALVLSAEREAIGDLEPALSGLRAVAPEIDLASLPRALQQQWLLREATLLAHLGDPLRAHALLDGMGRARSAAVALDAARLLLLLGDQPAAVAARKRLEPADHRRGQVSISMIDARLALAGGDEQAALDRLEDALAAAAPASLRRPFLVGASDLRPLLERRVERGTVAPAFAVDLLERMSRAPVATVEARRAVVDPLTDRERTILRYLASTLSNAEIAAELYVSVNTVKTHERALYRKLGVTNRRDAVGRARALDGL